MSFFEILAHDKASSDEALRTASLAAHEAVTERFSAFAAAYGEDALKVISSEIEELVSEIAHQYGVGHRAASIVKSAMFGLGNPLAESRKNWTQEQWDQHYQGQRGPYEHFEQHPEALTKRPELNGLGPDDKAEAIRRTQQAQEGAQRAQAYPVRSAKGDSDSPSPKMDKRLWTPKTVGPLKGVDDPKGKHPTKRVDIAVPTIKKDFAPLEDIGEETTERYDLNKDKQKSSSDSSAT